MPYLSEDDRGVPDPTDAYSTYSAPGEEKRTAETLCALYARQYGLKPKIARCFSFLGPYLPLDGKFAVGNFIRDGLAGGPIQVKGDGTPCRSYLYAADLAIWLWKILLRGETCRPYNVGSEESITIAELAHTVAQAFTPPVPVRVAHKPTVGEAPERYIPSVQRARSELGLQQTIDVSEAIHRTVSLAFMAAQG
jgi:dTDP-glucose 4,6-dehydratase